MKRILIFGPFNDHGGREIECAYLYGILSKQYEVAVFSSEVMSENCSLFMMHPQMNLFARRTESLVRKLKRKLTGERPTENFLTQPLSSFQNKPRQTISEAIQHCDMIILVAQVISAHIKELIFMANELNIPVVFRTTGTVPKLNEQIENGTSNLEFITKTDLFIHHSEVNAARLSKIKKHRYTVIDQCVYNEQLLPETTPKKIEKFCFAGSLNENKNVVTIIEAFKGLSDPAAQLHIFGEGPLANKFKEWSEGSNVYFYDQLNHKSLLKELGEMHCMIIASHREAGPYSALEAMAIGLPLISTKVGAMEARLGTDYQYWFDANDVDRLTELMNIAIQLAPNEVATWSGKLKARYFEDYSSKQIEKQYLETIHRILEN